LQGFWLSFSAEQKARKHAKTCFLGPAQHWTTLLLGLNRGYARLPDTAC
jgi:hypothetical protein